jgi:hypothetical protein
MTMDATLLYWDGILGFGFAISAMAIPQWYGALVNQTNDKIKVSEITQWSQPTHLDRIQVAEWLCHSLWNPCLNLDGP